MIKIDYEYKGERMEKLLQEAGVSLTPIDGEWFAADEKAATAQQICTSYPLDAYKAEVIDAILAHGAAIRGQFITRSPQEMASWSVKYQMALEVQAGRPENAAGLAAEAQIRGVALEDMVNRVLNNAVQYLGFEAFVSGMEGKFKDMALQSATPSLVGAIPWEFDWTTLLPKTGG
jgi:hypothetical protein